MRATKPPGRPKTGVPESTSTIADILRDLSIRVSALESDEEGRDDGCVCERLLERLGKELERESESKPGRG